MLPYIDDCESVVLIDFHLSLGLKETGFIKRITRPWRFVGRRQLLTLAIFSSEECLTQDARNVDFFDHSSVHLVSFGNFSLITVMSGWSSILRRTLISSTADISNGP